MLKLDISYFELVKITQTQKLEMGEITKNLKKYLDLIWKFESVEKMMLYSICGDSLINSCITTIQAEGNYTEEDEKLSKIKLVQVLVTSADKSHHLCIPSSFYCFTTL